MKAYVAFMKKEWLECGKTYKLLILGIVFLILGMENALIAKITPVLLENYMPEGMSIQITAPTAFDSWTQFYKNMPLGVAVIVILFSGILASEFQKGTLIPMLTKGLSRKCVIASKFTMVFLCWTAFYWMAYGISYGYTAFYWSMKDLSHIAFGAMLFWIFGIMIISILFLFAVLTKSNYGCLLWVGISVVVMMLLQIIPSIREYNPYSLTSGNLALLNGESIPADFSKGIIIAIVISVGCLFGAIMSFKKKRL